MDCQRHYDDNREVTLTTEFPWAEIDARVFGVTQPQQSHVEQVIACQERIWDWVYQGEGRDLDGFVCRAMAATWIFSRALRSHSMTEAAGRFGKKKQSLGRWVADFKKEFPDVTAPLQHIKNHD